MHPIPSRRAGALLALACASLGVHGCKKEEPVAPVVPEALIIVQGNFQSAQAGFDLPTPVILRVTDKDGRGLADVPVTLTIGSGGGSVNPPSAATDVKGEVKTKWTLGPGVTTQTLIASAPGVAPVTIHATGYLPSDIIVAQGNNQSARTGQALPNPIVVRIVATGNIPMVGVPVAFQVASGGGAIAPQSILTNALGEATVRWTMGLQPGVNTAIVTASTLSPVTLTATATP
jgi:hypothetical protein